MPLSLQFFLTYGAGFATPVALWLVASWFFSGPS